ncbi:uncharacterized protein [Dysidea avara]|uniref:uncharacterized protein isoform X3 n=1 Tax=Dysidea avara TaxID=196820 RepID=UPI0033236009
MRSWILICAYCSLLTCASKEQCNSEDCSSESQAKGCHWSCNDYRGVDYYITTGTHDVSLPSPRGAVLRVGLCTDISCGSSRSRGCIIVPGVEPVSTGQRVVYQPLEQHIPSAGLQVVYEDGVVCEVTKKPRKTIINLPCDPDHDVPATPSRAYEGDKQTICNYYVEFSPSKLFCPNMVRGLVADTSPVITAVSGCEDSSPKRTTTRCHPNSGTQLTIYGVHFSSLLSPTTGDSTTGHHNILSDSFAVFIGDNKCHDLKYANDFTLVCLLPPMGGEALDVTLKEGSGNKAVLTGAVSYRQLVNYRQMFDQFVYHGVGGMRQQIEELYRRAFASRDMTEKVLRQVGVGHVKGVLFHGPPGNGKTLLARTIGKILGSSQVKMLNGPEIISKFLGESERNLRGHFEAARKAWEEYGDQSEMFVIIIDEIDAICKPRGKSDQSAAAAAYDSLVNQLLTLMDGLNEMNNILVIGMTNRIELLDPALLRPGRFEVQIEVTLPTEKERLEIFEVHTRSVQESGVLDQDVSLEELAANTSHFSGAEIAGIVREAVSFSLERTTQNPDNSLRLTLNDFHRAMNSIVPAYTSSQSHILRKYLPEGYLPCGSAHSEVINTALELVQSLQHNSFTRLKSLLLYGPRGTGKTSLAVHISTLMMFDYIRLITASELLAIPDTHKIDKIHQAFTEAYRSDGVSIIILDDIDQLVKHLYFGEGRASVSHDLMHAVSTLITATPPVEDDDQYGDTCRNPKRHVPLVLVY